MTAYREILPHPALRGHVDRFWVRSGASASPDATHRILPDGRLDVIVSLGDAPHAFVVGAMTRPHVTTAGATAHLAAIRFQPGGAAPFLGVRIDDFTDAHVDSADAGAGWLVREALEASGDVACAVRLLQRALLMRLSRTEAPDPLVGFAARALWVDAPPTIDTLARRVGWSRQHLRRSFAAHVGVGPKIFGRVARLQRALAQLREAPREALAAQAVALGYFDQAHMARDFRALCGVAPSAVAEGSIFPMPQPFDVA